MKRFASGPLHGVALATYCLLVPYVVVAKWTVAARLADGAVIRGLLVALSLLWIGFVTQLGRNIVRQRRGVAAGAGGSAWLAALIVAALALAPLPASTVSSSRPATTAIATAHPHEHPSLPIPSPRAVSLGPLPLALVAKRRLDRLRDRHGQLDDDQIDGVIAQLRAAEPALVAHLLRLIANQADGVVRVGADFAYGAPAMAADPVVVCVVDDDPDEPLVAFAREGGRLRVPADWTDSQIVDGVVGLHDGGRVVATGVEYDLLRSLAIRSVRRQIVVYLGDPADLDEAVRASAVTVDRSDPVGDQCLRDESWASYGDVVDGRANATGVYVELLRADPVLYGLREPFVPTLRRRGVEMVAYLAVHRDEPVSGDRLRTRVLVHADVDASLRTLANTASTVRRSLGVDADGPLLHPVTADGLYRTHGLSSDVERFHRYVRDARRCVGGDGAPLLLAALELVRGEPLVGVRRGFEWFTVEGHLGRLQRDGEWAALALHDAALEAGDVEQAYWAIERGRRLDPYSDVLHDALARVPRLRQLRGDRTGVS